MQSGRVCGFVVLGVVLFAGGCSPARDKSLMPVTGKVTLEGKPLSGTTITFVPIGSTRGAGGNGYTDKSGKYELSATHGGKGVPVGEYRVVASKLVMPDGSDFPLNSDVAPINSSAKEMLPAQYTSPENASLRATVHEGANEVDFALELPAQGKKK